MDILAALEAGILGVEVKWSDRIPREPRYLEPTSEIVTLDKTDIVLFLAHFSWKRNKE